jgi:20S proteasome alpha/beta subunit
MTLVIALKLRLSEGEAVLVSSDSRVTYGPIAYESRKVHPIYMTKNNEEIDLAVAGGAGDSSIVKYGYSIVESVLRGRSERLGFRPLSHSEFREAIQEIEEKLLSRLQELRRIGIDFSFNMALGSVDQDGTASLYVFDHRGLAEPVHDDPGFAIIGKGAATGGVLLTRLLGYSPERSSALELGMLSAFVIDMVSEIDPEVGPFLGESILMRVQKGRVTMGPLEVRALKEYKARIEKRRELLRELQLLCDRYGEEMIEKAFRRVGQGRTRGKKDKGSALS